MTENNDV